jgi:outer membrane protein assembly factor BamB
MTNADNPVLLSCPTCNAPIDFDGIHPVTRCKFCGNTSVLPVSMLNQQTPHPSAWNEVFHLIENGDYDQAINHMQSTMGIDIKESNDTVNAIASGRLVTPAETGRKSTAERSRVMEKVQSLVIDGDKAKAVTLYKDTFALDSKHAEDIVNKIAEWAQSQVDSSYPQVQALPAAEKHSSVGVVAFISFFILLVGFLAVFFMSGYGGLYVALQPDILLPANDAGVQSIAGMFYDSNSEDNFIGVVDGASGKMAWKSKPLSGDKSTVLAHGSDLLYAANGTTLMAFHLSDGSLAWQNQMSDAVAYSDVPMLVTPSRLLVVTADYKITAYDAAGGSQVWTRQQASYYSDLHLLGDSLVVRDYQPGTYDENLFLINPVTGEQQQVINPVCEKDGSANGMDSNSMVEYDEAGNALFVVLEEGCVQRYELGGKTPSWNVMEPDAFTYLYAGDFKALLTDTYFYLGNKGSLIRINKSDGVLKVLTTNEDYDFLPLAQIGDNIIVRNKRNIGTTRFELWGIDADSGQVLWQKNMQDTQPIDPPDEMAGLIDDTDWGYTWHVTDAGLALITFQGEPGRLIIETLNPADGVTISSQTISINAVGDEFYSVPLVIEWVGNVMYLTLDSDLYALDITEPKMKKIY